MYRKGGGPILGRGTYDPPTDLPDRDTFYGNPSPCYSFSAQIAEVEVDRETGQVKLLSYHVADDVGQVINPLLAEGQAQGCVSMGLGMALSEQIVWKQGQIINPNFMDYKMPCAADLPAIHPALVESFDPAGPFGAKSASEITINVVPAAITNAIYDAVGVRIKDLPITPEKILSSLEGRKGK